MPYTIVAQRTEFIEKLFTDFRKSQKPITAANKVNFGIKALESIANRELKNRFLTYLNYKKEDLPGDKNLPFINTPHPIGNLSAKHGIILDFIARIINIELRLALGVKLGETKEKHKNPKAYIQDKVVKYKDLLVKEGIFTESDLNNVNNIDQLLAILSYKFVGLGIDTAVISKPQQSRDAKAKIEHLGGENNLNWDRSDGDGDPRNAITEILGKQIRGQTLLEIYQYHKAREGKESKSGRSATAFEPRISCKDKRGVDGITKTLSNIPGVMSINIATDLLDQDKFDLAYAKFESFIETLRYGAVASSEYDINSLLDLILRATLPNYSNASGLVLSDFPQNGGEKLLAQLSFIKRSVDKFLDKNTNNFQVKPQKFLPLCENEDAINKLEELLEGIFSQIEQEAAKIVKSFDDGKISTQDRNKKLTSLKNKFCGDGQFVFGAFFGPSDLTADMGGVSIVILNNKRYTSELSYRKFQKDIKLSSGGLLNFDDIEFVQEYGKGSSPKRGGNFVLTNLTRTNQGQSPAATDRSLQRIFSRNASKASSFCYIPETVLNQSIKNHRYFGNNEDDLGLVALEYNELAQTPRGNALMQATTKKYANNQGTRGKSGLVEFQDQRAIGLAALTSYIGLLQSPAFPFDVQTRTMADWSQNDFRDFVNHPAGFAVLINELYQFCAMDFNRAKILGFSNELIDQSAAYVDATIVFLSKAIGINSGEIHPKSELINRVSNIVAQLQESDFISSAYLKKRLDLFSQQMPLIHGISHDLTESVKHMAGKSEITDEDYAQNGIFLTQLANFQLPTIASNDPKTSVRETKHQRLVLEELNAVSKL